MKIYDIDGKELLDVPVTSAATHEQELGKSDYVRLSWVSDTKQVLAVGSYIIPFSDGLKYRLLEPYTPNQNNESEWKYEPEFQHPLMWLSKIPFTYTTVDKNKNMSYTSQDWPYLGLTTSLLQVVVDQINDLFGFTTEDDKFTFEIVGSVDTTVNVTFSSMDILSALTTIANACENNTVEWHISWENKCLYFGQIFFDQGEKTPTLKVGENVGKVSVTSTKDGYYNVFFPQGSTRNISTRLTNGHYLASSLRLGLNFPLYDDCKYPDGTIDTRTNTNEPKQVLALTFDDVYPHVNCYVYNVRSRTETKLIEGSTQPQLDKDGNPTKYSIWYFRLAYPLTTQLSGKTVVATTNDTETDENGNKTTVTHYWYDYFVDEDKDVVDGYKLCGQFAANTNADALPQPLLGQPTATEGFEMVCHQNDTDVKLDDGTTVKRGDFEVVYSESNDLIIPTTTADGLYPRGEKTPSLTANEVILYNIVMTENEIRAAQDDLLIQTNKEIAWRNQDLNNYSFSSYPSVFEENNPNLYIGQKVNFDDNAGTILETRIIKLSVKIDFPFEQTITVGNQKIKGNNSQLKEDVRTIMSGNWSGGGLNNTQVRNIIQNYGRMLFLSKTAADTASGKITLAGGAEVRNGLASDGIENAGDFSNAGNATLAGGAQFGGTFIPGLAGKGGQITGEGRGELRSLTLWEWLEVPELRYNKVSVNVGMQWQTSGGGIIESVTPDSSGAETGTCRLKLEDGEIGAVAEGDLCMGIWHDTSGNETQNSDDNKGNFTFAGFKTVYFQVTGVSGTDNGTFTYMLRSSSDGGNSTHPFEGMHFAQRGNISDTGRQAFRYTTTEYSVALMNVSTWEFQASNYFLLTGNIEGFSMPAVDSGGNEYVKTFHGHGTVLGNAYIFGGIDQFERISYRCFIDQSKGGSLLPVNDSETCTVVILNGYGEDVTKDFTLFSLARNSGDSASDEVWDNAHTSVTNPFTISSSDLGIDGIHRLETVFTLTATNEATDATAKKELEYNS